LVSWPLFSPHHRHPPSRPRHPRFRLHLSHPVSRKGLHATTSPSRAPPSKDCSLIVFAQDRVRWTGGSRDIRTGRPDQDGRFKVGLPAGKYYAIAVDYVEPGDATDPELLDRVRSKATAFSLGDGETKTVDLKLGSAQ
jgi:hypothetical protein